MNSGMNAQTAQSDEWGTPDWLFRALDTEFKFALDPCASSTNAKCSEFFTKEQNGLDQSWGGPVFINPPYSDVFSWVWRALHTQTKIVMLLPVRTDNDWFSLLADAKSRVEFRFFRKRIAFLEDGVEMKSPRFASMVVVLR